MIEDKLTDNSNAVNIFETKAEIVELPDNSVNQQSSTTESDGNTISQCMNVTSFIFLVYIQYDVEIFINNTDKRQSRINVDFS